VAGWAAAAALLLLLSLAVNVIWLTSSARLRRGHFVILPLQISFIWQIPIVTRNSSDK
jgi:hypothetical protein